MKKLIKRLHTKYFDRYTEWELIHYHLHTMFVENGKCLFRYVDVYTRIDKYDNMEEIKRVYINPNSFNVWSW